MRQFYIALATLATSLAHAQTTWTLQGSTLKSYGNHEAQYQGTNPNTGGDPILYTYSGTKSLPRKVQADTPPTGSQPPWSSSFATLSNTYLRLPFSITNHPVKPQMQVVIYVTWIEEKGSEGWSDGSHLKSRVRDWVDNAAASIDDIGINDPLGEYHDQPVSP